VLLVTKEFSNAPSVLELPNLQRLGCIGRSAFGSGSKDRMLISVWHDDHAFLIRDDHVEWATLTPPVKCVDRGWGMNESCARGA
jgi:hypothetical protein